MRYSNAQILSAVITEWSRPVITQITSTRLAGISYMRSMEQSIINTGLVSSNYKIAQEIMPFANCAVDNLVQPILESYLSKIPDAAIPSIARQTVATAMQQPKFSILEGLITFEQEDLKELYDLIEKNLPVQEAKGYQVKH